MKYWTLDDWLFRGTLVIFCIAMLSVLGWIIWRDRTDQLSCMGKGGMWLGGVCVKGEIIDSQSPNGEARSK